jgi:hypothetical protein
LGIKCYLLVVLLHVSLMTLWLLQKLIIFSCGYSEFCVLLRTSCSYCFPSLILVLCGFSLLIWKNLYVTKITCTLKICYEHFMIIAFMKLKTSIQAKETDENHLT